MPDPDLRPAAGRRRVWRVGACAALGSLAASLWLWAAPAAAAGLPRGFVYLADIDPTIVQEMRYAGHHNFVGRPVAGYGAPECILTREAALALKAVQARLAARGLSLKIYDCYRPERAVRDFLAWSKDAADRATGGEFYPTLDKRNLFKLGYIATRSAHSRGSTVDLTAIALPPAAQPPFRPGEALRPCHLPAGQRYADNSLDFGTGFDCFHELSHTASAGIGAGARANRAMLVEEMRRSGFRNYAKEWWHFELDNEPFPTSFFDFPIVARARPGDLPAAAPPAVPAFQAMRLRVVCAGGSGRLAVRDVPSLGGLQVATLAGTASGLRFTQCEGKFSLAEWHALDAIGQLAERTYAPWCQVEAPGEGPGAPPVLGWAEARFLAPMGQEVACH